jgi:hypothetical protein
MLTIDLVTLLIIIGLGLTQEQMQGMLRSVNPKAEKISKA